MFCLENLFIFLHFIGSYDYPNRFYKLFVGLAALAHESVGIFEDIFFFSAEL
jgi:hypothetical protein